MPLAAPFDESMYGFPRGELDTYSAPNLLRGHWRADLGITKYGADKVSNWADLSRYGFDLATGGAVWDPTWVDAIINGKPVIRFGGAHNLARTVGAAGVVTVAMVFIPRGGGSLKGYWGWQSTWSDSTSALFFHRYDATQVREYLGGTYTAAYAITDDVPYLHILEAAGSPGSRYLNNDPVVQTAYGTPNNDQVFYIGNSYNGYATFDVAEIWHFSGKMTPADREKFKALVNAYYAIW